LQAAYCSAPCCAQQPETLTHALLTCPEVAPAASWLCRLWGHLTGAAPPEEASVLLADDQRGAWRPAAAAAAAAAEAAGADGEAAAAADDSEDSERAAAEAVPQLWSLFRTALVHAAWERRSTRWRDGARGRGGGAPLQPAAAAERVAAAVVATVVGCMRRDWTRVASDPRSLTSVCSSWFRGRDPRMSLDAFRARWCAIGAGALCEVRGGGSALVVRLSTTAPVPFLPPPPPPP
jgi:hypothetical protein